MNEHEEAYFKLWDLPDLIFNRELAMLDHLWNWLGTLSEAKGFKGNAEKKSCWNLDGRSMPRSIRLSRATLFDYVYKFGSSSWQAFGGGMPTILTILPLCDVCEDEFVVLRSIGWLSFQFYSPATDMQPVIVSALTSTLQIADRNYPSGSLNRHVTAVTIQLLKEATWERT